MTSNKEKTLKIEPHVHEALTKIGRKGESFSDIIFRLVKEHEEHNGK